MPIAVPLLSALSASISASSNTATTATGVTLTWSATSGTSCTATGGSAATAITILKDAGLVDDVADGTRRIYRLNAVALAALRDQLDTYWRRALAVYADVVEAPGEED